MMSRDGVRVRLRTAEMVRRTARPWAPGGLRDGPGRLRGTLTTLRGGSRGCATRSAAAARSVRAFPSSGRPDQIGSGKEAQNIRRSSGKRTCQCPESAYTRDSQRAASVVSTQANFFPRGASSEPEKLLSIQGNTTSIGNSLAGVMGSQ